MTLYGCNGLDYGLWKNGVTERTSLKWLKCTK